MRCEDVRAELAGHLIGDLEGPVGSHVREHLDGCAACREEAAEIDAIWTALDAVGGEPADSVAMRRRFDEALDLYREGLLAAGSGVRDVVPDRRDRVSSWVARWWPRQPVQQAGLAAVLLTAGFVAGRAGGLAPATPAAALADLQRELRETRQLVMLSLLQQPSAVERLRGVGWSHQIDEPGNEVVVALIDRLAHDPNVNVRLAVVDALRQFSERPEVRAAAVHGLSDRSAPLLQIALIDFIVDTNHRDAIEALGRLAEDPDQEAAVRERASQGLKQFS